MYGQRTKFARVIKISQAFVFPLLHLLVAAYRGVCRNWLNIYSGPFFSKILNGLAANNFRKKAPSQMFKNRLLGKGLKN